MADKPMKHLETDMEASPPRTDILCRDCIYRQQGEKGYANGHCQKYAEKWKPSKILYQKAPCDFYEKE